MMMMVGDDDVDYQEKFVDSVVSFILYHYTGTFALMIMMMVIIPIICPLSP